MEEEPETASQKTFTLYSHHIAFLENINENTSSALRIVLNSVINGEDILRKRQILDNSLVFVSMGFIFFFIFYLIDSLLIKIICLCIGIFLLGYGCIGGVFDSLQSTRRNKQRRKRFV